MKKVVCYCLVFISFMFMFGCGNIVFLPGFSPLTPQIQLEKDLMSATVVIYGVRVKDIQNKYEVEGYDVCTATAFERRGDDYFFVTAAHCFNPDYANVWCLSLDEMAPLKKPDEKKLFTVTPLVVGNQYLGQDLAVVASKLIGVNLPTMPLASSDPTVGDNVINVAAPKFRDKQLYRGVIKTTNFYRTIFSTRGANWQSATLIALSEGSAQKGSSGSSVVSGSAGGIVAILVGNSYWEKAAITLPISQFKKFWKDFLSDMDNCDS
ncbi:MAG: hypothetical protein COU29_02420 [Candidatus Magasanikbacteria bacterium CG10_big_fil_rev_8_21_14_0_10_36_32]|uniref:Peptidase S1 domain-containing protein n=1 Tax=Candidatus Magasanikbacteria bacterium CG10_big_fil_rev_8_21_14_0_10_36_32 TaxID=1974646 RepID=A0A2M6W786_9BACT|nr:MAG: hypothetical protein COU29_02420 [Candidatus Magasanikbacteria bacterium CG10_big_fil_rev_8_21_14_0_10_36_32]